MCIVKTKQSRLRILDGAVRTGFTMKGAEWDGEMENARETEEENRNE